MYSVVQGAHDARKQEALALSHVHHEAMHPTHGDVCAKLDTGTKLPAWVVVLFVTAVGGDTDIIVGAVVECADAGAHLVPVTAAGLVGVVLSLSALLTDELDAAGQVTDVDLDVGKRPAG